VTSSLLEPRADRPAPSGSGAPGVPRAPPGSPASSASPAGATGLSSGDATARLALVRELGRCADFDTAAALLCTRLAAAVGAARVVLGWRDRPSGATRPVALSDAGEPEWQGDAARMLVAAMDEAIAQSRILACPPADGERAMLRATDTARRAGGAAAVVTVPLAIESAPQGALLAEFERPPGPGAGPRLHALAELALPWLRLLRARRAGRLRRALGLLAPRRGAPGARPSAARLAWGAGLAGVVIALAVPIELTVGAPARIEGEVQRTVAAPIRGYLKAVRVRPGDMVREGDVLAELGDRDLELDRARLRSELAQHEGGVSAAMARGERAAMAVAQAKVDETRARLGLVDHQLEQIRLRSPIDGVVLQGDLWQQLGAPVDRGQSLFVVAPARRHRVIVELDERDLRRVEAGTAGRLALSALPWDTLALRIERMAPAATTLDGRNVFELEARLDAQPGDGDARANELRAGQRGVVHLSAGRGPLALDWARRAGDALARLAWRWLP
jgi:hypothetical protein